MFTTSSNNPLAARAPFSPGKLFTGGKWVASSTGAEFSIISPGAEEVYARVAEAG